MDELSSSLVMKYRNAILYPVFGKIISFVREEKWAKKK